MYGGARHSSFVRFHSMRLVQSHQTWAHRDISLIYISPQYTPSLSALIESLARKPQFTDPRKTFDASRFTARCVHGSGIGRDESGTGSRFSSNDPYRSNCDTQRRARTPPGSPGRPHRMPRIARARQALRLLFQAVPRQAPVVAQRSTSYDRNFRRPNSLSWRLAIR